MGLQRDAQVEVAGRTALATWRTLTGQPNQLAVAHSGGEVDIDIAVVERQSAATSLQRVLQRQLEQRLAVDAAQRPAGGPARATARPASEQSLEQVVAELHPGVLSAEPLAVEELLEVRIRRGLLLLAPIGAESVISLALVRIRQHLIRLAQLFEAVLGVGVGIEVGVVGAGKLAIRAADRVLIGVARDAQHLVVIRVSQRHRRASCRKRAWHDVCAFLARAGRVHTSRHRRGRTARCLSVSLLLFVQSPSAASVSPWDWRC